MTASPDPDHPIAEWVAPFLAEDGTIDSHASGGAALDAPGLPGVGYTVFGCTLDDNPTLAVDDGYRARVALLADRRLLHGSWRKDGER